MDPKQQLKEALEKLLAGRLSPFKARITASGDDLCLELPAECLREAAGVLKADPGTDFSFLACISGVDRLPEEPRFEVVYHLRSLTHGWRLVLKAMAAGAVPAVPSLTEVWGAAEWLEREVWDLFGIRFHEHPDLRRILLPHDWEGFPLRKDYPLEGPGLGWISRREDAAGEGR